MFLLAIFLLPSAIADCLLELMKVNEAIPYILSKDQTVYTKMASSSGININDLGSYEDCNQISSAHYAHVELGPIYSLSLCAPKDCSESDLTILISQVLASGLKDPNIRVKVVFSKERYEEECSSLDSGAKLMIVFICIIACLALISTGVELFAVYRAKKAESNHSSRIESPLISQTNGQESSLWRFAICFSLYTNSMKLFQSRSRKETGTKDFLEILDAIKTLAIVFIIIGNVSTYFVVSQVISNYKEILDKLINSSNILFLTSFFAIDTLFWLSGLLVAYFFLKTIGRAGTMPCFSWISFYTHRFLRVSPLLFFALFFWWSMTPYLGNGPTWYKYKTFTDDCDDYWWTVLAYLNNVLPGGRSNHCLEVSQFFATDMQLFLVSPVILLLYHKSKKIGWGIVVLLSMISMGSSGMIANQYNLSASLIRQQENDKYEDYYLFKPYTRCGSYALGLAVGMVLYSVEVHKNTERIYDSFSLRIAKLYANAIVRYFLALIGLVLMLFFILIQTDIYKNSDETLDSTNWIQLEDTLFLTFCRTCFILGVTLFFLPCLLGYFSLLSWILRASFWAPLSRLGFSVYLFHFSIVNISYLNQQSEIYLSNANISKDIVFFVFISFLVAIPVCLLIEFPCKNLEELFFRKRVAQESKVDEERSYEIQRAQSDLSS